MVANIYKLDGLKVACEITGLKPAETLKFLERNLSKYAGLKLDGGEIISEVFADISTGNPTNFSRKFDEVIKMTRRGKGCMSWMDNEDWYYIDEEKQRFLLTDKAPEEARRSFELYTRVNWRHYKDLGAKPLEEDA